MTTPTHAAPWTFRRLMSMLIAKPAQRRIPPIMTGREATARHLFGESVQWSRLDMLDYDNSPLLRGGWLAEADRRIAGGVKVELSELLILRHWGYVPAEWVALDPWIRNGKRDGYYGAKGLGA